MSDAQSDDTTAQNCPNCRVGATDDDCPHLLPGDDCPNCGDELMKPPAGKVRCSNCRHVINGQNAGYVLSDFEIEYRQAVRLLDLFGCGKTGTPGSAGTKLRQFCHDHDLDMDEFNDLLADLRGTGAYADE
jgi:hypothetical protein